MPNPSNVTAVINLLKRRALERDKQQHLALSYGLVVVFFFIVPSLPVAAGGTLALGLCKEAWDKHYGSGFCWYDMLANAAGTGAGMATIVAFTG
ncbi:hypothetical protein MIH18_21005 [Marinobacter sp. M3C]|jgi:hypothetical protein|uniref:hypothetical protein n=1 Tax=unclassified Marinobacter TaxID=83889 RepID=UPI00200F952B|nr:MULTISPECIES: hypothetical protein [unclassified Marinobacter]UQG54447.1 hypothetical protein MIH16_13440 [Marinobacter sp. M4C]UQG60149.1 hypothetical protein MIH18_21005 [Marinobacter sp. M3C]UQG63252.1 hypothetical protein MIH17_13435 [Marinobacter sp. M2C]UQG67532.1 hypothetical protein MIH19_13440 [Marinobacter sp. M1C]